MGLSFFSFITFFLPIGILLFWVIKGWGIDGVNFENFFGYFLNSLILGFLGSLVVLLFSLFFLYLKMNDGSKFSAFVVNIACSGYALPGTLLAVGVYAITFKLDTLLSLKGLLSTGLFAMLFSYFVRFFAVAWKSIDSELFRISQSIGESASLHCKSNFKIFTTIFLPMIKNGIWTGSLLVGVDIIKELPLTLMMRPLNYDTLAVKIFNYTSEGLWAPASLPALGLVAIGLIPVTILIRQTSRKMNHAKN